MLASASLSSFRVLLVSSLLANGWLAEAAETTTSIPNPPPVQSSAEKQSQAAANYDKLPLSFEPNQILMKHLLKLSFALLFVLFLTLPLTAQVSLGSVRLGATASAAVALTLPTAATLGNIQVLTEGVPDLDYTLASGGSCTPGNSYAANETCTVEAEFAPRYPGVRSGAVVLFDNSGNVLATAYLVGIGSGPQTTFSGGSEK